MATIKEPQMKSPITPEGEAKAQDARTKRFRDEAAAFRRRGELTTEVVGLISPSGSTASISEDAIKRLQAIGRELMEQTATRPEEEHHA